MATPQLRIDHIQLAIPPGGEAEVRAYYGPLLGLEEREKPAALAANGGLWLESSGLALHFGVDPDFRASAKAHVALAVEDYDAFRLAAVERGLEVQDDERLPGRRRFYLRDPFGNRLEFLEH